MKVGLLHPRSGVGGLWAPALEAAAQVGAAELNAQGGIAGSEIELVVSDCGFSTHAALAAVDALVETEEVDAIIGGHASNVRDAVSHRIAQRVPYIYTPQFEGGAIGPSTAAIGSIDADLLYPALTWFKNERRAERFFFVGNDYVWPRRAAATTHAILGRENLHLVGERLISTRLTDYSALIAEIARSGAQVVVLALIGFSAVGFHRAFAAAGLDGRVLRFGLITDEMVVCNIGADATANLFTASHYFSSQRSRFNEHFLERYHEAFGDYAPPISCASIGYYEGLHALSRLVSLAGEESGPSLARHIDRFGSRQLRAMDADDTRPVFLAAADGSILPVLAQLTH